MLMNDPRQFEEKARNWAVLYAGAPKTNKNSDSSDSALPRKTKEQEAAEMNAKNAKYAHPKCLSSLKLIICRYEGYNHNLIDRFVNMGFSVERVVEAFKFYQVPEHRGRDFELQEHHMSEITARLLGEPAPNPNEDLHRMMDRQGYRHF